MADKRREVMAGIMEAAREQSLLALGEVPPAAAAEPNGDGPPPAKPDHEILAETMALAAQQAAAEPGERLVVLSARVPDALRADIKAFCAERRINMEQLITVAMTEVMAALRGRPRPGGTA